MDKLPSAVKMFHLICNLWCLTILLAGHVAAQQYQETSYVYSSHFEAGYFCLNVIFMTVFIMIIFVVGATLYMFCCRNVRQVSATDMAAVAPQIYQEQMRMPVFETPMVPLKRSKSARKKNVKRTDSSELQKKSKKNDKKRDGQRKNDRNNLVNVDEQDRYMTINMQQHANPFEYDPRRLTVGPPPPQPVWHPYGGGISAPLSPAMGLPAGPYGYNPSLTVGNEQHFTAHAGSTPHGLQPSPTMGPSTPYGLHPSRSGMLSASPSGSTIRSSAIYQDHKTFAELRYPGQQPIDAELLVATRV